MSKRKLTTIDQEPKRHKSNDYQTSNITNSSDINIRTQHNLCDNCDYCNKRMDKQAWNPICDNLICNNCTRCNDLICNNFNCRKQHYQQCSDDIYLFQIKDYTDNQFQQNLFSIFMLFTTKTEYKSKVHTFDGYFPFNSNKNKTIDKIDELETKQCKKLHTVLNKFIGHILSTDLTLLISQYGFGNIVKCNFCSSEHHIICDPTPSTLLLSPQIYTTVMLKQFKPYPIWLCKPLYFDDITRPILQCSTSNHLIQCEKCEKYYALNMNRNFKGFTQYSACHKCVSKELKKCCYCHQYPLHPPHDAPIGWWNSSVDAFAGMPALYCAESVTDCNGPLCNDCVIFTDCGCGETHWHINCTYCAKYCNCTGLNNVSVWSYGCYHETYFTCHGCHNEYCGFLDDCCNKCELIDCDCGGCYCRKCYESHYESHYEMNCIVFTCCDCKIEYRFSDSFGDDIKKCDSCGENWICVKCNSFQEMEDNDKIYCQDCNYDEDTYINNGFEVESDDIDLNNYEYT
eukprot:247261_1